MSNVGVVVVAAGLLGLVGASDAAAQAGGELAVGVRNPAGVFVKSDGDRLGGFDIELLERFAAWHQTRYGQSLALRYQQVETIDQLLDLAEAQKCDLAIGSITVTAERAKRVDFSQGYLPIRMVLFAKKGRLAEGPYQQSLRGRTLGALAGSTGVTRIEALRKEVGDLNSRAYPDYESLFRALLGPSPEIDGIVTDVTHYWVLSLEHDLTMVAPMSDEQGLGLVLPKGSPWKAKIDAFIDELTHAPGYFQLVRRYFGKEASDMLMFSRQGGSR